MLRQGFVRTALLTLTLAIAGCGSDAITSGPDTSLIALPGQEVRIKLGNVGPGTYDSPPQVSSTAVQFVDVAVVPPYNPGGPTQQFRFRAVHSGTAVVTFRRVQIDSSIRTVEYTIRVR